MATAAILDRLFHKAHIFNIDGNSFRLKGYNQMIKESEANEEWELFFHILTAP